MGRAIWADAADEQRAEAKLTREDRAFAKLKAEVDREAALARRDIGVPRYQVQTNGRPRGPWRDSHDEAMGDAVRLGLASYDRERREHFLAVPVAIATWRAEPRIKV